MIRKEGSRKIKWAVEMAEGWMVCQSGGAHLVDRGRLGNSGECHGWAAVGKTKGDRIVERSIERNGRLVDLY